MEDNNSVVVAATPDVEGTATAEENTSPSHLLREWAYPPSNAVPAAVVLGEEVTGEAAEQDLQTPAERFAAAAYQIPVASATFVRDLVRTSMDQIYQPNDEENNPQQQQQQQQHDATQQQSTDAPPSRTESTLATIGSNLPDETLPFSVRSEADAQGLAAMVAQQQQMTDQQHEQQQHHTVSARTVDDYMNEEAEFILVDGDLIALPPSASMMGANDYDMDPHPFHPDKSCRPSRMRRGVRKIGKWFHRGKGKKNPRAISSESTTGGGSNHLSLPQQQMSNDNFTPANIWDEAGGSSRNFARQASLGEDSTHSSPSRRAVSKNRASKKQQKQGQGGSNKQSRRSWRQRDEWRQRTTSEDRYLYSDEGGDGTMLDPQQQQDSHQRARVYSTASLPSQMLEPAETGLLTASQLEMQHDRLHSMEPPPTMRPIHETSAGSASGRTRTVTAMPIGTAEQLSQLQEGLLPPAHAFVEFEIYEDEKEKKEEIPASLVPKDSDYKVDKADAPDVETMLLRAAHETISDLEHALDFHGPAPRPQGKSDGSSVPLSQAKATDTTVHNDMLKVLLVGSVGEEKSALARAIRGSQKKPRKRSTLALDVHTWAASDINFQLWDVQGSTTASHHEDSPNFGAHPGTQSLFFSSESLYLLVWDLACHNPHVHPVFDYDSDEEEENDYAREQAIAEADRALQEDIASRVIEWVDRITVRAPHSSILPIGIIPAGMEENEVKRRCSKMFEALEQHVQWNEGAGDLPNIVLDSSRNIICVTSGTFHGATQVQKTMVAMATDASRSVFNHIGTPVPPATVEVLDFTRSLKRDHKLIRLDHILGVLGDTFQVEQVIQALHFLASVGEVMYFGTNQNDVLSSFVILSRQWLVSALSCILRNDLKRELNDARKFMNMQCIYSEQQFQENEVIKALDCGAGTSCPLLTDEDAAMLWRSMSFMREAADRYSQLNENSTSAPTMFYYLERLLVNFGIFMPFGKLHESNTAGLEQKSEVFFVPSLLSQADPGDTWSYRNANSWTTTLCHSWLLRDGAPSDLFEHVAVALLRDLYLFSRQFAGVPRELARTRSTPLGRASKHDFVEEHSAQKIGPVRIHQIICWKSAMLLKIGTIFPDRETDELRESFVEVFVTMVDQNSAHCVSSDAMRGSMQRVIVSGRGQSGLGGLKLFKGGYQAVLDSVQSSLANLNNVNMQVVCPECLGRGSPRRASTWGWDEVLAAAEERIESTIVCRRGHRVKSNLLSGMCKEETINIPLEHGSAKPVTELLPSVVLIGLWDPATSQIRSVGSGFIADKKFGLIVTAGHVLFDMEEGASYGTPYLGIEDARIVIGVIPKQGTNHAVWRYFAEIVVDDVRNNVDACVLKLTTKMENDVDKDDPELSEQPESLLDSTKIKEENLLKLKLETNFDLDDSLRILGYSQREGREGGVLRSPDFARGFICRLFSANLSDDSSSGSDSESRHTFSPREEVVVLCPTIVGHSGGPATKDSGAVVGILSRADPTDPHRCFLVPAGQLKSLIRRAKGLCSRPVYPQTSDMGRFATT